MSKKNKYWSAVLYPENMIDDWQVVIGDMLQLPFCYCIHDKDFDKNGEIRKTHVHLIIVFPNTTTENHAKTVFSSLSAEGKTCFSTLEGVFNIRHMYDYLIHDTEACLKQGKYQYEKSDRISGNNFDIGSFEQMSLDEKEKIANELCDVIMERSFVNFGDFYLFVRENYDLRYFSVLKSYSGLFERLTKANYQKTQV